MRQRSQSAPTCKSKSGRVVITVNYGYDVHSIQISGRTYKQILAGKPLTVRGQGFFNEERTVQDRWRFNEGKYEEEVRKGALYVYLDDSSDIYSGDLSDGEVFISVDTRNA